MDNNGVNIVDAKPIETKVIIKGFSFLVPVTLILQKSALVTLY
ncbi:hypothetical protein XBI1_970002 [Xenorhabdus bovienii str. Intermedium]|uniref:Uncharacterized protein n=1 Tax=Xenorhabdus bovienii str. Intermedium TaxID=1379677 RepID=A0A077QGT6_XENBV|nr:hypothetical protein XBI1_970002 [Xenorhabdus bovienii str. Intermedium]